MRLLRTLFLVLLAIVGIVLVLIVALMIQGRGLVAKKQSHAVPQLRVEPDSSLIARGAHIVEISCVGCHGKDFRLPLSGSGENFFDIPGGPKFGTLYAPNLTPGGVVGSMSDGQLSRAIREGVGQFDRALLVMPSPRFHGMSDRDLAAVIAFMRSQPAVQSHVPDRKLNPAAYLVLGLHLFETSVQLPVTREIPDVPEAMTAEYGEYLVPLLTCADCHGENLRGGKKGQFPPIGPDLVGLVATHTLDQFERALRQGVSARDGHALDPMKMPFPIFSRLSDTDVGAIYAYLQALKNRR